MSSPTQRSLEYLRKQGYLAAVIEQWISFPDKINPSKMIRIKRDVFGADILYFHPATGEVGLCQTTTRANQSSRIAKAKGLVPVQGWINNHPFVVHGWAQRGPRGKRKVWEVQVTELGTEDEKKITAAEAPLFVREDDF